MLSVSVQRPHTEKPTKTETVLLMQTGCIFFPWKHPDITKRDFIQETTKASKDRGKVSWTALGMHAT